jgi:methionyl-tRNA formyltransferase
MKKDGLIDWKMPAVEIERHVRVMQPWPGAYSFLGPEKRRVVVLEAACEKDCGEPGEVLECGDRGILVAAGEGSLLVTCLQAAGKKVCNACDYLRGRSVKKGDCFGNALLGVPPSIRGSNPLKRNNL